MLEGESFDFYNILIQMNRYSFSKLKKIIEDLCLNFYEVKREHEIHSPSS